MFLNRTFSCGTFLIHIAGPNQRPNQGNNLIKNAYFNLLGWIGEGRINLIKTNEHSILFIISLTENGTTLSLSNL